jgi:hypothetical protein
MHFCSLSWLQELSSRKRGGIFRVLGIRFMNPEIDHKTQQPKITEQWTAEFRQLKMKRPLGLFNTKKLR